MPSSFTTRNRLTLQATGESINLWGQILNSGAFDLIDKAMDGVTTISASGPTTLTTANGADDEARSRVLNVTATAPAQITIPSVEKFYIVRAASADVTITNGTASLIIKAGDCMGVVTDGVAIWPVRSTDFGGARIKNVGAPVQPSDAASKGYVDGLAFNTALPDQEGNEGRWLATNGVTAGWFDLPALTSQQVTDALGFTPEDGGQRGEPDGYASLDSDGKVPSAQMNVATGTDLRGGLDNTKFATAKALADADKWVEVTTSGAWSPDFGAGRNFSVILNGNLTFNAPTNMIDGQSGTIRFQQDVVGSRTIGLSAEIKKFGTYTLSTSPNAVDRCGYVVKGTVLELTALEKALG